MAGAGARPSLCVKSSPLGDENVVKSDGVGAATTAPPPLAVAAAILAGRDGVTMLLVLKPVNGGRAERRAEVLGVEPGGSLTEAATISSDGEAGDRSLSS